MITYNIHVCFLWRNKIYIDLSDDYIYPQYSDTLTPQYENTPIRIYWKFHHHKMNIFK